MDTKFRVWDKDEKRFWYFTLQEILERRMTYRGSWDEKVLRGEKTQWTGLRDRNGKDIYVGDIVLGYLGWSGGYRRKSLPKRVNVICEVVFQRGSFDTINRKPVKEHLEAYGTNNYRNVYYKLRPIVKGSTYSNGGKWDLKGDDMTCPTIEVIGNIYEDSELLSSK